MYIYIAIPKHYRATLCNAGLEIQYYVSDCIIKLSLTPLILENLKTFLLPLIAKQ